MDLCNECSLNSITTSESCECPLESYFIEEAYECILCDHKCLSCLGNGDDTTTCLECKEGYYLNATTSYCECNEGTFYNGSGCERNRIIRVPRVL